MDGRRRSCSRAPIHDGDASGRAAGGIVRISPGELVEGGGEYAYGGDRVVDGGEFCRRVAASVLASSEYIAT